MEFAIDPSLAGGADAWSNGTGDQQAQGQGQQGHGVFFDPLLAQRSAPSPFLQAPSPFMPPAASPMFPAQPVHSPSYHPAYAPPAPSHSPFSPAPEAAPSPFSAQSPFAAFPEPAPYAETPEAAAARALLTSYHSSNTTSSSAAGVPAFVRSPSPPHDGKRALRAAPPKTDWLGSRSPAKEPPKKLGRPPKNPFEKETEKERRRAEKERHVKGDKKCAYCDGDRMLNKKTGRMEQLISCTKCGSSGHPTCLQLTPEITFNIRTYDWECFDCKTCEVCGDKGDDSSILFCDHCDRGWHMGCLDPPLLKPPKGTFICPTCRAAPPPPPPAPPRAAQRGSSAAPAPSSPAPGATSPLPLHLPILTNATPSIASASAPAPAAPTMSLKIRLPASGLAPTLDPHPQPKRARKNSSAAQRKRLPSPPPEPEDAAVVSHDAEMQAQEEEEEEEEEEPRDPFEGVLEGEDKDLELARPRAEDKERFERARKAAEAKLGTPHLVDHAQQLAHPFPPTPGPASHPPHLPAAPSAPSTPGPSHALPPLNPAVRALRERAAIPTPATPGGEAPVPVAHAEKVKCIRFGGYEIDTWYSAPYPEEYSVLPGGKLWLCEWCLGYRKSGFGMGRHKLKCKVRHPPGDEIYRSGNVSIFEVDGRKNKIYCQNLCLLAKMFLDHKTLYYDVEPFLFYVMTETDEAGARFVGYFSKEKRSGQGYNVSCIMTLPVRQRKGWGALLIDFSYLLSKKEGRVGTPERPLSKLGLVSYRKYWTVAVFEFLRTAEPPVTLQDISAATSMTLSDIVYILSEHSMIHRYPTSSTNHKPSSSRQLSRSSSPRKSHKALRNGGVAAERPASPSKDPTAVVVPDRERYEIRWDAYFVDAYCATEDAKGLLRLDPTKLKWRPFVVSAHWAGEEEKVASPRKEDVDALLPLPKPEDYEPCGPPPEGEASLPRDVEVEVEEDEDADEDDTADPEDDPFDPPSPTRSSDFEPELDASPPRRPRRAASTSASSKRKRATTTRRSTRSAVALDSDEEEATEGEETEEEEERRPSKQRAAVTRTRQSSRRGPVAVFDSPESGEQQKVDNEGKDEDEDAEGEDDPSYA